MIPDQAQNGKVRVRKRGQVKCGRVMECEYVYRDIWGGEQFIKHRFRHDPCICGRGKSFGYAYRPEHGTAGWAEVDGKTRRIVTGELIWQKPVWADWYLYRLDQWWNGARRGRVTDIWWTEGEKDADVIAALGGNATTHHQGAGHATVEQARWLLKAKKVYIVADLDLAGAYCAAHRHDLLIEAGFKGEIRVVRAREGNDAADHVAAGYRLGQMVDADMDRLAEAAKEYRSASASGRVRSYVGEE